MARKASRLLHNRDVAIGYSDSMAIKAKRMAFKS